MRKNIKARTDEVSFNQLINASGLKLQKKKKKEEEKELHSLKH